MKNLKLKLIFETEIVIDFFLATDFTDLHRFYYC